MNHCFQRHFRRVALLFVLILIGTGCRSREVEPTQTPISTPPPEPVVAQTPTPAPTQVIEPTQTPTSTPSPTQVIEPTQTPTSTPAPTQALEAQESEVVLYEDDFKDINSGWPNELVFDNYYIGYHEPDWYHVEVHEQNDSAVAVLPGHSFDDFTVETEVVVSVDNTAASGDFRYGLAMRRAGNRYYAFTISPRSKRWSVFKSTPTGLEVLAEGTDEGIRDLAELDTLRVDAQGDTLTFHLNGQLVSQVSDADYAGGELGFYVETFDAPRAHIHYESLTIQEAPEEVELIPSVPTPTTSPRPETPLEASCTVVTPMLNLREGPDVAYEPPIAALPSGTRLEPLARSSDALWIQVRVPESGQLGWVAAAVAYVSCDVSMADLPVGELPPRDSQ